MSDAELRGAPPLSQDTTAMILGLTPDTRTADRRCGYGDSDIGACLRNRDHPGGHFFERDLDPRSQRLYREVNR